VKGSRCENEAVLVILDANVLIADFRMDGNAFRILLADGGEAGIRIGIPEVVVREATRKLRRELEDRVPRAAKLTDELRKLLVDAEISFDVETTVSKYETRLRDLATNSAGWELLPMPDVEHSDVLGRLHSSRAPARGDGKGYQDILIWETLKAQLHRDSHVVLVSNDGDFADSEGQLDAELTAEASRVRPDVHVELIRSLKALVEEHVVPLRRIEDFWQSFDRSRQTDLENALGEKLVRRSLSPDIRHMVTPRAGEAWINSVVDMSDVEIRDARMLSNDEIAFEMLADVEVVVETDTPANDQDAQQVATWLTVRAEARWDSAISQPSHIGILETRFSG
jgi:predicted nucleic acid-binding protein